MTKKANPDTELLSTKALLQAQIRLLASDMAAQTFEQTPNGRFAKFSNPVKNPYRKRKAKQIGQRSDDVLWRCCSYEHAIVWRCANRVPELAPIAALVAANRSIPNETILRALILWEMVLRQNLLHRGIEMGKVKTFKHTTKRPIKPIREPGPSRPDTDDDWIESDNHQMDSILRGAMKAKGTLGSTSHHVHAFLQHAMTSLT